MKRKCTEAGCHYIEHSIFCKKHQHPYLDITDEEMNGMTAEAKAGVSSEQFRQGWEAGSKWQREIDPTKYPVENDGVTVIGPGCFTNGEVISYEGENYVRQEEPQAPIDEYDISDGVTENCPYDRFEDGWVHTFIPEPITAQIYVIFRQLLPPWMKQFALKSADYENSRGNVSENFGILGQYMKLHDKVGKLRRPLWDDRIALPGGVRRAAKMNFEQADEILDDLIGHAFLTKSFLAEEQWRQDRIALSEESRRIAMSEDIGVNFYTMPDDKDAPPTAMGFNKSAPRPPQSGPK